MRVIAGVAKGRKLKPVPGKSTRPISDRVKEALFGIIGGQVVGARFLDLFAGTGGVAIEALSRGACWAVLVERNWRAVKVIRENLRTTGFSGSAQVIKRDVFAFVSQKPAPDSFDFIYVAPPQYKGLWSQTLISLDGHSLLSPDGQVVVQIFPKEFAELDLQWLTLVDQRRYGSTMLCFYAPKARIA